MTRNEGEMGGGSEGMREWHWRVSRGEGEKGMTGLKEWGRVGVLG